MADTDLADTDKSWHVFHQYTNVMNEYFTHFSQSTKFVNSDRDKLYLLLHGLSTLNHVFTTLLHNTLDSKLALKHMNESIFYYTQFIDQIEENALNDLNVSSISASVFVYSKTLNSIEQHSTSSEHHSKTDFLKNNNSLITIYRKIVDTFIINNLNC